MQRRTLLRMVLAGFALLGFSFLAVLFSSLGERKDAEPETPFADLNVGETAKRRHNNQRVWVTKFTADQQSKLDINHPCARQPVCMVSAAGVKSELDVVYSRTKPPQLTAQHAWNGGFVDPTTGAVFDLSGNAILPMNNPPLTVIQLTQP